MTMAGVGIREYARHRAAMGLTGATDAAVRKAIADGRIAGAVRGSGRNTSIDPAAADALWGGNTNPTFQRDAETVSDGVRMAKGKPAPLRPAAPVEAPDEPPAVEPVAGQAPMTANRLKIQTAREMQKYKREEWEFSRDRGEWLKKQEFLLHVGDMSRAYQAQWKAFVDGNAAEIAAELDIADRTHDVHRVLDKRVRKMFERMSNTKLGGGQG